MPTKTAEARQFTMHPDLLYDVIRRQAGTLHKALLEAVMNAVDAGASRIAIRASAKTVEIADDGRGMPTKEQILKVWEVFGAPAEAGENKTYGQFRMGRGQLFAFGGNRWRTGHYEMTTDIQAWGLKYKLRRLETPQPGCLIRLTLYEELRAWELDQLRRELSLAVKFAPLEVCLNGDRVSRRPEEIEWDHELPEAYIRLQDSGSLYVYNLGVLVCSHPGHVFGCGGEVVSRRQLKVNFARNDVMRSCPVWRKVQSALEEYSGRRLQKRPLNDAGRQRLADQLGSSSTTIDELQTLAESSLFTDVTGKHWSLKRLCAYNLADRYGRRYSTAPEGHRKGDHFHASRAAFVFADATLERFDCSSGADLGAKLRGWSRRLGGAFRLEYLPFEKLAQQEGDIPYRIVPEKEWLVQERLAQRVLDSALAEAGNRFALAGYREGKRDEELEQIRARRRREIRIGTSAGQANGWTDGRTYIAIDRDYLKGLRLDAPGWLKLLSLLLHELCHDTDDRQTHVHGHEFYQAFHDRCRDELPALLNACVRAVPAAVKALQRRLTQEQATAQEKFSQLDAAEPLSKAACRGH